MPGPQQKLLQVPCYEDALNMILDFDDQDDGASGIGNWAKCPRNQ